MNNPFDHAHIQEEKAEREARRLKLRTNLLIALFCGVLGGFCLVLYQLQVVQGASYRAGTNSHITDRQQVESIRGEILDRYGRVLVTNELSYNVELDWNAMEPDQRLDILARLLEVCREEGVEWADTLPITKTAPWRYTAADPLSYQVTDEEGQVTDVSTSLGALAEKWAIGWVKDAALARPEAGELLAKMCVTFGLLEEEKPTLSKEHRGLTGVLGSAGQSFGLTEDGGGISREMRELAGVLYEIYLRRYEVTNNTYVFAQDVDITFIAKVKEQGLAGVRIVTASSRKYGTGVAAHVLGYTGKIDKDEWPKYKELGYPMDAVVGIEGVELAFEERLHGSSGLRLMEKDNDGNIISQQWKTEPAPGENAVLTLDIALQATVEDLLAEYASRQERPVGEDGEPEPAKGLAAAVVDMTGGVLALASYPTYDLAAFRENFTQLQADESRPLLNRATQGQYSPGSTFKMLTAIAALDTGTITTAERLECTGVYTFYPPPYQPRCWYGYGHGRDNVTEAIKDSCNCFFYDAGRRTTIANINEYARKFGLGEYTGIELVEKKGLRAGPETSKQLNQQWYDGDTLSASIGQGNNLFTPLQLANYVATLVNGGDHYACHLLKEFKSNDYSQVTEAYSQPPKDTIDLDPAHVQAVKQGMYDLSKTATMAKWFDPLPVEVGCKTGTAETQAHAVSTNALFVCFAPYDDPQVALCLVSEGGDAGGSLAELAAGILAQYFSTGSSLDTVTGENALLR